MGTVAWIVGIVVVCLSVEVLGKLQNEENVGGEESSRVIHKDTPEKYCDDLKSSLDHMVNLNEQKTKNETAFREECSSTLSTVEKLKEKGALDACAAGNNTILIAYEQLVRVCSHGMVAREAILARIKRQGGTTAAAKGGEGTTQMAYDEDASARPLPAALLVLTCALRFFPILFE